MLDVLVGLQLYVLKNGEPARVERLHIGFGSHAVQAEQMVDRDVERGFFFDLAQQAGLEEAHAADPLVHVDDRGPEYVGGDHRHGIVGKLAPGKLQRGADAEIHQHHDHVRGDRMIENEPGQKVDENDAQHQARK